MRDPEKEVERPSASRAPTHNVYEVLPASRKPHIGTKNHRPWMNLNDPERSKTHSGSEMMRLLEATAQNYEDRPIHPATKNVGR